MSFAAAVDTISEPDMSIVVSSVPSNVKHLHEMVKAQYRSVERAIIGQGEFIVAEGFAHHRIPYCRWHSMSAEQQQERVRSFMNDSGQKGPKKEGLITSTDGLLTVTGNNKVARKPGQRKRPKTERAAPKKH